MIYQLGSDSENFRSLTYVKESDAKKTSNWGKPGHLLPSWDSISVKYYDENGSDSLPIGDICGFSGPAMRLEIAKILHPIIGEYGEFLPLRHVNGLEYYAFHATNVLECFDIDRSSFLRTRRGIVYKIVKPEFDWGCLDPSEPIIFKDPRVSSSTYLTEKMMRQIENTGVSGFLFPKVWPHE